MGSKGNVKFAEKLHDMELKYAPDQINMASANARTPADLAAVPTRSAGVMDEQFPTAALTTYDERDRLMNAKLELGEGAPMGYTPFGKMEAKEADFDWYQKKQAAVELANFQRWFAKEFDLMSPVQKKRAKELYPEFYAQRKQLLRKQAKNLFDLARIKLEGIDKFKDLVKVYMAETGRLDVGPLKNLLNPEMVNLGDDSGIKNKTKFQRGLANPFLVFGKEVVGERGNVGVPTRHVESQQWARRATTADWAHTTRSGVEDTDFPPFKGPGLQRGDQQWFQVLRQGMSSI